MDASVGGICVLFAEVVNGSRLHGSLGEKEAHHAVERCLNRMERAAATFKGTVIEARGGRLAARFDSAGAAVDAAIEMQNRIEALPPVSGVALAVRIGIHAADFLQHSDTPRGDALGIASKLAMLSEPGRVLASGDVVNRLPLAQRAGARSIDAQVSTTLPVRVFQIIRNVNHHETADPAKPMPTDPIVSRLRLRVSGSDVFLGPDRPMASLGRDSDSDIVIQDSRASRSHGRIELRRDQYVLIDQSTNGTYVTLEGKEQFLLRCDEAVLRGRGQIRFGHAAGSNMEELLEFEILG
jgi:class 3 adenylate cyclase